MRVLVTGATGFIGSHTVQALVQRGHQVVGLSRAPLPQTPGESVPITYLNGSLDNAPWEKIQKFAPEACIHSAWITTPSVYLDSRENDKLVVDSLDFLKRLEHGGVNRFVVLGTCIEYDLTSGKPLHEDHTPTKPEHRYSQAKVRLYDGLRQTLSAASTLTWARIFYPYGWGESPERLSSLLIRKGLKGDPLELKQPDNVLDYIHVSDLASALTVVLEKFPGGCINIGTGKGISVRALAEEICTQLDCSKLLRFPETGFIGDSVSIVADNSKLLSLGWKPEVSIGSGIKELINKLGSGSRV